MMKEELKEKILSHAVEELYIEDLSEFKKELEQGCYLVKDGLLDKVVLTSDGNPCVCFDAYTGEFLGLEDINYARRVGEEL